MKKRMILAASMGWLLLSGCIQYTLAPENSTVAKDGVVQVQVGLDHCLRLQVGKKMRNFCAGTNDVYGLGFDLNYDPVILEFQSLDLQGSALRNSTAITAFRNSTGDNGKLVVGISKIGPVSGELVQGLVATVIFKAKAEGSTELTFRDPQLLDSAGKYYVGWPFYNARLQKAQVTVTP